MNADEIVRALRQAQENYKHDIVSTGRIRIDEMARDCADCIESLQAQLSEISEQLAASQRKVRDARNELCLKCGKYHTAHLGACDGCRWKKGG